MLNEDNKSILDLIEHVDSKITSLRKNDKFSKNENIMNSLSNLYNKAIGEWMGRNYLFDIEPNPMEEEMIINKLLEVISFIDKL